MDKQIGFFYPPRCCLFLLTSCYIQRLQGLRNRGGRSCREIRGFLYSSGTVWSGFGSCPQCGGRLWGLFLTWSIIGFLREVLLGVSKYFSLKTASGFLSATGTSGVHLLQHHRVCESSWAGLSHSFLVYKNLLKWKLVFCLFYLLSYEHPPSCLSIGQLHDCLGGPLLRQLQESSFGHTNVWTMRSTQLYHTHNKGTASLQCSPSLCSTGLLPLNSPLLSIQRWFLCILSSRKTQVWFSNGSLKNLPLTWLKVRMTHLICFPLWDAVIEHTDSTAIILPPMTSNTGPALSYAAASWAMDYC